VVAAPFKDSMHTPVYPTPYHIILGSNHKTYGTCLFPAGI
jgi:hypothetical protein